MLSCTTHSTVVSHCQTVSRHWYGRTSCSLCTAHCAQSLVALWAVVLCTGVGGPGNAPSSPTFRRFFRPPTDVYKYPDGSGDTEREREREREVPAPKRSHGEVKAADSPPHRQHCCQASPRFSGQYERKKFCKLQKFFLQSHTRLFKKFEIKFNFIF